MSQGLQEKHGEHKALADPPSGPSPSQERGGILISLKCPCPQPRSPGFFEGFIFMVEIPKVQFYHFRSNASLVTPTYC